MVTPPPRRQFARISPMTRSGCRNPNSSTEPLPGRRNGPTDNDLALDPCHAAPSIEVLTPADRGATRRGKDISPSHRLTPAYPRRRAPLGRPYGSLPFQLAGTSCAAPTPDEPGRGGCDAQHEPGMSACPQGCPQTPAQGRGGPCAV